MDALSTMRGGRKKARGRSLRMPGAALMSVVALTVPLVLLELAISDSTVRLIPLMIIFPALTAAVGTLRETVHAVVWVILVIAAVLAYRPLPSLGDQIIVMVLALALGMLCVLTCQKRIRREEESRRMRSGAAALQRQMLRPLPVLTDRVIVDGVCLPVEEDLLVGGDIYEAVASPYGTRLLIGDVQGKGLPAVAAAFAVLGAFRETAQREPTLTAVADALETAVGLHNAFAAQTGEPERFVTALILGVNGSEATQALNCGHFPLYLLDGGPVISAPSGEPGVPLGLADLSAEPRTVDWFTFPPGATLLLCSDGVTEARDSAGECYPLEEQLRARADVSPWDVAHDLADDLRRYTGGDQRDDITVLVVRRSPESAVPTEMEQFP
ncbi:PP2C family protein-serine/threonine phosphatase [Streptomyces sp. ME01-24h]|nr:PP2C family protein-serine/threonine phosphatase [Streptomyces sp. ME19-03-3]MDX3353218.1 PP2C family protein-serine/threonine phosphatase [Streptomyces sp. ME01-24h]